MIDKNKPYEQHARDYTKRYLSHTEDYNRNVDNDYYNITKFTEHIFKKYKNTKEMNRILEKFIKETKKIYENK